MSSVFLHLSSDLLGLMPLQHVQTEEQIYAFALYIFLASVNYIELSTDLHNGKRASQIEIRPKLDLRAVHSTKNLCCSHTSSNTGETFVYQSHETV